MLQEVKSCIYEYEDKDEFIISRLRMGDYRNVIIFSNFRKEIKWIYKIFITKIECIFRKFLFFFRKKFKLSEFSLVRNFGSGIEKMFKYDIGNFFSNNSNGLMKLKSKFIYLVLENRRQSSTDFLSQDSSIFSTSLHYIFNVSKVYKLFFNIANRRGDLYETMCFP